MKTKLFAILICILLVCNLTLPALAASEGPQIKMQPQNYHYPEHSVAIYTVKATGTNLHITWYLEYDGKTYNLSDNQNAVEPWEGYAGETYGPIEDSTNNTYSWFFGGIEEELSGSEIWCVIEDGHYTATSSRAIITVQGSTMPPEIIDIPSFVQVTVGEEAAFRCIAKTVGDSQLSFRWYETTTGKLQDVRAIDGEDSDFLICNTDSIGTRYYVCCVTSTDGGMVYSSVVPVTVIESVSSPEPDDPTPSETTDTIETTDGVDTTSPDSTDAETQIKPQKNIIINHSDNTNDLTILTVIIVAVIGVVVGFGIAIIFVKKSKK